MFNPTLFPATLKDIFKSARDALSFVALAAVGYAGYYLIQTPSIEFLPLNFEKGLYAAIGVVGCFGVVTGALDTALKIKEYRYYKKLGSARSPR